MDGWPRSQILLSHPALGTAASGHFHEHRRLSSTFCHRCRTVRFQGLGKDGVTHRCHTSRSPTCGSARPPQPRDDFQGTNAMPVSFFKQLKIKRPEHSSYFRVNAAAKYHHVSGACKTKEIDKIPTPGKQLCLGVILVHESLPAPVTPSQGPAGLYFPFFWLFNSAAA